MCPTTPTRMNDSYRMQVDAREERLLTVHARECEWTLGGVPREERLLTVYTLLWVF